MTVRQEGAKGAQAQTATASATDGLLTRDAILRADDTVYEIVPVPEWGGSVRVKSLSGFERDRFEASLVVATRKKGPRAMGSAATGNSAQGGDDELDLSNIRAKMVAATVVDLHGNLVFTEKDVEALGKKSSAALTRVFVVARRLSKFTSDDIEELVGNSDGTPAADT